MSTTFQIAEVAQRSGFTPATLRYYEDMKVDDIAACLEISSGAIKRYLSDGLAKMAISLGDDEKGAGRAQ